MARRAKSDMTMGDGVGGAKGAAHHRDSRTRETDALAKLLLFRTDLHAPDPAECSAQRMCTRLGTSRGGACTCIWEHLCTDRDADGRRSFAAQLHSLARLRTEWREQRKRIDRWERERRREANLG
eukprot:gene40749-13210_t